MRTIKITVLLAVLLNMVGVKTFAHDIEVKNDDGVTIYYNFINGNTELEVTYRGKDYYDGDRYVGNIIIPESVIYNGKSYNVTSIGSYAFSGCKGLTSVTISKNINNIGGIDFNYSAIYPHSGYSACFYECTNLFEVTINNKAIASAYYYYNYFTIAAIFGAQVKQYTLSNDITSIGNYAFYGCTDLTKIVMGNAVETINSGAFANCKKLEDVYCYTVRYPYYISSDAFNGSYIDYVTLHVPAQSVTQYKNQSPWSGFMDVVPLTDSDPQPTSIDATLMNSGERTIKATYDLGGKQFSQPQRGLNIVKMSDGTTKKVVVNQ